MLVRLQWSLGCRNERPQWIKNVEFFVEWRMWPRSLPSQLVLKCLWARHLTFKYSTGSVANRAELNCLASIYVQAPKSLWKCQKNKNKKQDKHLLSKVNAFWRQINWCFQDFLKLLLTLVNSRKLNFSKVKDFKYIFLIELKRWIF